MSGGIQVGTTASSVESKKIDKHVRQVSKKLSKSFSGYSIGHRKKQPIFEDILIACVPDGGIWLNSDNKVFAAFEAKHQGIEGNAIERWCKNFFILESERADKFRYVTFISGLGAHHNEVLDKFARSMMRLYNSENNRDINVLHDEGISFFLNPEGFMIEQVEGVMRKALS